LDKATYHAAQAIAAALSQHAAEEIGVAQPHNAAQRRFIKAIGLHLRSEIHDPHQRRVIASHLVQVIGSRHIAIDTPDSPHFSAAPPAVAPDAQPAAPSVPEVAPAVPSAPVESQSPADSQPAVQLPEIAQAPVTPAADQPPTVAPATTDANGSRPSRSAIRADRGDLSDMLDKAGDVLSGDETRVDARDSADVVFNFFANDPDLKFSKNAAIGAVGSFSVESASFSVINGYGGGDLDGDGRGDYFGFAQDDPKYRFPALRMWAARNGLDYTTLNTQLLFAKHELLTEQRYAAAVDAFRKGDASPAQMASIWGRDFEGAVNSDGSLQGESARQQRAMAYAQSLDGRLASDRRVKNYGQEKKSADGDGSYEELRDKLFKNKNWEPQTANVIGDIKDGAAKKGVVNLLLALTQSGHKIRPSVIKTGHPTCSNAGFTSNHTDGKAVDLGNAGLSYQEMVDTYKYLQEHTEELGIDELIWAPAAHEGMSTLKDGKPFTYDSGTLADHGDHIHVSVQGQNVSADCPND
jgi:hypothetical protein